MRTRLIVALFVMALLLTAGTAFATPVEYVCKENKNDKNPLRVVLDEEWGMITLDGEEHRAQFTSTQVLWEETPHSGGMNDFYSHVHTMGSLQRATGVLSAHADPYAPHPHRTPRSGGAFTVTCVKVEKPS